MTADDTSRDALIEQVARRIHEAADYEVPVMPWDQQTDDWRAEVSSLAAAVVDAVVMPLVQERAEAWERGYMFAFAQERGDHTHSRPVPDYLADDIRSWNPYITEETP